MVSTEDYLGTSFGRFEIVKKIGSGAEAEVFLCVDKLSRRPYALRLDVQDDNTWEGNKPLIPPQNISIEQRNILSTRIANQNTVKSVTVDGIKFKFNNVDIYGIKDNYYLIPLTHTRKVKNSWDVLFFIENISPDDIYLFELWEVVVLQMLGEALIFLEGNNDTSKEAWIEKWGLLTGGKVLTEAIKLYRNGYVTDHKAEEKFIELISEKNYQGKELAENLIIRLCGAVSRGRMTLEEANATLYCKHFRSNITLHELHQIVFVINILQNIFSSSKDSLNLLFIIIQPLFYQPYDEHDDYAKFEENDKHPSIELFTCFLQEYAGFTEFLTLKKHDS